jgi:hypothetical protein
MSKAEEIRKIENILIHACYGVNTHEAEALYDAGYRDVTDLKKWLKDWDYEEWDESYVNATPKAQGQIIMAKKILKKLESL